MHARSFILLLCCIFSIGNLQAKRKPFFDNEIIRLVDGMKIGTASVGLGGKDVHDMLWILNEIRVMQNGHKDPTTNIVAKPYTLNGVSYTTHDLAIREKQLLNALNGNNREEIQKELEDLQEVLQHAKQDFIEKTTVLIQQIHIMKSLIVQLIEEWCHKRHREDSILHDWIDLDNTEVEHFKRVVTSNVQLNEFLNDLKQFLTDLVHSCPKAFQEFMDNKEKYFQAANKQQNKK